MVRILIFTIFLSSSVYASNPQIRVCNNHNGLFHSLRISKPKNDIIGFCRYKDSFMGSISAIAFFYENYKTMALNAFFQTQNKYTADCSEVGAKEIKGKELLGAQNYLLCIFDDYSFLGLRTLQEGWHSDFNKELVESLTHNL